MTASRPPWTPVPRGTDVVKVAGSCGGVSARDGVTQTVYLAKSLTVRGGYSTANWTTPDPVANPSIVNAGGLGRVFFITGTVSPVIEGLRITGGDAKGLHGGSPDGEDVGGGIYIVSTGAIITNNHIYGNVADDGGGVASGESNVTLFGNSIYSNTAGLRIGGNGGGLSIYHGDVKIQNNRIFSNYAIYSPSADRGGSGAGLDLYETPATITGNWIWGNNADGDGGGISLTSSPATVSGNTIHSNWGYGGAGINLTASAAILSRNIITGNEAYEDGGGVRLDGGSDAVFTNTVVADNVSNTGDYYAGGSGLTILNSAPRFWHTTIARNTGGGGVGVALGTYSAPATAFMTNTIIAGHSVGISAATGTSASLIHVLWNGNTANTGGAGLVDVSTAYTGDPPSPPTATTSGAAPRPSTGASRPASPSTSTAAVGHRAPLQTWAPTNSAASISTCPWCEGADRAVILLPGGRLPRPLGPSSANGSDHGTPVESR